MTFGVDKKSIHRDGKKQKIRAGVFAASLCDVHLHPPSRENSEDPITLKGQDRHVLKCFGFPMYPSRVQDVTQEMERN